MIEFLHDKCDYIWLEPRGASHHFYLKLGAKPLVFSNRLPSHNWEDWSMELLKMPSNITSI